MVALEENNKLKEHSWTQVAYSSKPKGTKSEIPTQNFYTPTNNQFGRLLDETFEDYAPEVENMDICNFFTSQRSLRGREYHNSDSYSVSNQPRRKKNHKKKVTLIGDSQVKYIKSENLNTPKFNVSVRSVSGLKVEQVQERFSHKLARSSKACVIVHAGTNNLESGSVDVILDSYENLANLLVENAVE